MKHTPPMQAASGENVPLIEHVLAFFEGLLHAQEPAPSSQRGRPATICLTHLWLASLLGLVRQAKGVADIWRLLTLGPLCSFAALSVRRQAVRQRLLEAPLSHLHDLLAQVNSTLSQRGNLPDALGLAPFAREVVALDESTLDAVARLCADVKTLPNDSPILRVGKLAGVFDLRRQCWRRVQFRSDVLAHCKTGALLLLEDLPVGSLIVADLGYFSFLICDYLTAVGQWWLFRLKPKTSFTRLHVFYEQGETLDALIWLGAYRSDHAAHAARLLQFRHEGVLYQYVTNVLDPHQFSMADAVRVYARRWDIELAFKLLKAHLGLRLWWSCTPHLLLQQIYLSLMLAQVLHHLQQELAAAAGVDPFEVSVHVLLKLLRQARWPCQEGLIPTLLAHAHDQQLLRPHTRRSPHTPLIPVHELAPLPADLPLVRPRRHTINHTPRHPRSTTPFDFRCIPRWLI
jgi:hypothetical protein